MRVARVAGAEKEAKIREEKIVEKSPSFKEIPSLISNVLCFFFNVSFVSRGARFVFSSFPYKGKKKGVKAQRSWSTRKSNLPLKSMKLE